MLNNIGPRIPPCRTPLCASTLLFDPPSAISTTTSLCNALIMSKSFSGHPKRLSFFYKRASSPFSHFLVTVSKAFLISRKPTQVSNPCSFRFLNAIRKLKFASLVPRFSQQHSGSYSKTPSNKIHNRCLMITRKVSATPPVSLHTYNSLAEMRFLS